METYKVIILLSVICSVSLLLFMFNFNYQSFSDIVKRVVPSEGGIGFPSGSSVGGETIAFAVYSDASATTELTSITWGTLTPGDSRQKDAYLKNKSNPKRFVNFTVATDNWNPVESQDYMQLTLSFPNGFAEPLEPQGILRCRLTLTVFANITGITDFSFDIIITGVYE